MEQKRYEYTRAGWRQRLPSIVLRAVLAFLLLGFSIDGIHANSEVDRAGSIATMLTIAILYCNIDALGHDLRMFFEQPTHILGVPLLLVATFLGFYYVYLNA